MKRKPVTVADLAKTPNDAHLYCDECGTDFSATAGDYWALHETHVFEHCNRPMRLARKVVRYVTVST